MSISIYSSAFNLLKNNFEYEDAIENFCRFAEEVVIAVNTSEDSTYDALYSLRSQYDNLKVIQCDISYDDPLLDGKVKNEALQATTLDMKIGLDMDERIPLRHKERWLTLCTRLFFLPVDAFMIPSLNLWGSYSTVKNDLLEHLRSYKWYLHGPNLHRGAVAFARKSDGTIDTSKSDSCELIYEDGSLAKSMPIKALNVTTVDEYLNLLEIELVYVYHLGYADFQNRVDRNKNFWYKHWRTESGGDAPKHQVHMDVSEFRGNTIPHNLPHWNE